MKLMINFRNILKLGWLENEEDIVHPAYRLLHSVFFHPFQPFSCFKPQFRLLYYKQGG